MRGRQPGENHQLENSQAISSPAPSAPRRGGCCQGPSWDTPSPAASLLWQSGLMLDQHRVAGDRGRKRSALLPGIRDLWLGSRQQMASPHPLPPSPPQGLAAFSYSWRDLASQSICPELPLAAPHKVQLHQMFPQLLLLQPAQTGSSGPHLGQITGLGLGASLALPLHPACLPCCQAPQHLSAPMHGSTSRVLSPEPFPLR